MPNTFQNRFPYSAALGLKLVTNSHDGFDERDLWNKLGGARFAKLRSMVKSVFVCGHATYPAGPNIGCEVFCYYAADVENFLKAGN